MKWQRAISHGQEQNFNSLVRPERKPRASIKSILSNHNFNKTIQFNSEAKKQQPIIQVAQLSQ